jgi:hypothetical protein
VRETSRVASLFLYACAAYAQPSVVSFEESEGYSLGAIGGQQGWEEFSLTSGVGSDVVAIDGRRALRLTDNPSVANGRFVGGLSPELFDPGRRGEFSVDVRIDDLAGASYTVVGQSLAKFGVTFRVVFEFGGTIFVVDETDAGVAFVDTNVFFDRGEFRELRVEWTPFRTTYYYDDEMIYESTATGFARALDQVVLASDAWQDGGFPVGEGPVAAYFDDVRIAVPSPGAWVALGACAFAACSSRRRYAGPPCAS